MRIVRLLTALLFCLVRPSTPLDEWDAWLSADANALAYRRTRDELQHFSQQCKPQLADYWTRLSVLHSLLTRVVVLDVRHNFNGLGDTHERLNFHLRVGRALDRAAFLWSSTGADPHGLPGRAAYTTPERVTRPWSDDLFDAGEHATGLGGVAWRWSARQRSKAEAAHPAAAWLWLQYECLHFVSGGCRRAQLRFGENATVLLDVSHAGDGAAERTALAVFTELSSGLAASYPLLRLQMSHQTDFEPEARLPRVCPRPPGAPRSDGHCPQHCESFANWRPTKRTWAALAPHLRALDGMAASVALTARTGVADQIGAKHAALGARLSMVDGSMDALARRVGALFTPCPPGTKRFDRAKIANESACVNFDGFGEHPGDPPPSLALARRCGGGVESEPLLFAGAGDAGVLGAFVECAARSAQALGGNASAAWGVFLFSDAPALKCLLEASPLGRAGRGHVTPSFPGHVQYAPPGRAMRLIGRSTVVDWYLLGLVDWHLVLLGSAFSASANVRRSLDLRAPPGGEHDSSLAKYSRRGVERFFEAGRENYLGLGVQFNECALLCSSARDCPVTWRSVRRMEGVYEEAQRSYGKPLGKKRGYRPPGG